MLIPETKDADIHTNTDVAMAHNLSADIMKDSRSVQK